MQLHELVYEFKFQPDYCRHVKHLLESLVSHVKHNLLQLFG